MIISFVFPQFTSFYSLSCIYNLEKITLFVIDKNIAYLTVDIPQFVCYMLHCLNGECIFVYTASLLVQRGSLHATNRAKRRRTRLTEGIYT